MQSNPTNIKIQISICEKVITLQFIFVQFFSNRSNRPMWVSKVKICSAEICKYVGVRRRWNCRAVVLGHCLERAIMKIHTRHTGTANNHYSNQWDALDSRVKRFRRLCCPFCKGRRAHTKRYVSFVPSFCFYNYIVMNIARTPLIYHTGTSMMHRYETHVFSNKSELSFT